MPIHWLFRPIFAKKKINYKIIGSLFLIMAIIFLIQALKMNIKQDNPISEQPGLIGLFSTISVVVILILIALNFIASYYRSRYKKEGIESISQSDKFELLQLVRNKVIVGLQNTSKYSSSEVQEEKSVDNFLPETILDYFSSDIRSKLRTQIKNKTIFTLIEIAYQDPSKTNPTRLSKNLNIPLSSLSREIKELISLNYLETYISDFVLEDTRLRNFKITTKGFIFLSNLNIALNITIDRLKARKTDESEKF